MKQEEDDRVKIEAKSEVTPQTKEYLGSPETGQGKKGSWHGQAPTTWIPRQSSLTPFCLFTLLEETDSRRSQLVPCGAWATDPSAGPAQRLSPETC